MLPHPCRVTTVFYCKYAQKLNRLSKQIKALTNASNDPVDSLPSGAAAGQILQWDNDASAWVAAPDGPVADGDSLTYDSGSARWVNTPKNTVLTLPDYGDTTPHSYNLTNDVIGVVNQDTSLALNAPEIILPSNPEPGQEFFLCMGGTNADFAREIILNTNSKGVAINSGNTHFRQSPINGWSFANPGIGTFNVYIEADAYVTFKYSNDTLNTWAIFDHSGNFGVAGPP